MKKILLAEEKSIVEQLRIVGKTRALMTGEYENRMLDRVESELMIERMLINKLLSRYKRPTLLDWFNGLIEAGKRRTEALSDDMRIIALRIAMEILHRRETEK